MKIKYKKKCKEKIYVFNEYIGKSLRQFSNMLGEYYSILYTNEDLETELEVDKDYHVYKYIIVIDKVDDGCVIQHVILNPNYRDEN